MSEDPAPTGTPAVQSAPPALAPSSEVVTAVAALLRSGTLTEALNGLGELLISRDHVDMATIMMVQVRPRPETGWESVGDRAWFRSWHRPGTACVPNLPPLEGRPRALSLPWLSPLARDTVVGVPDRGLLPAEAARDAFEMQECHVGAVALRSITRNGELFGSVSTSREKPGRWTDEQLADLEVIGAALASRLAEERAALAATAALQRADHAADTQQQFFASLGHELRTPIAAILGGAEMLEVESQGRDDEFARSVGDDARVILKSGEQLLAIVEDLLGTGRALGEDTARRPVDAAEAVDDVLHWMRATAATAGVTVTADIPRGLRATTTPVAIRQILTNLIGNAITHNRAGGTVTVSALRATDEYQRPRIHIRVTDDGPGLTAEQQREVFKPFVRFAAPGVAGTGLGLSLSRSLAERDGGLIGVESAPGRGATFWVDLPAAEPSGQSGQRAEVSA